MSFEMESIRFTKKEIVELTSNHTAVDIDEVGWILELLTKLGVVSEYVFKEEPKVGVKK